MKTEIKKSIIEIIKDKLSLSWKSIVKIGVYVLVFILLLISVKGVGGNIDPQEVPNLQTRSNPFELSPERGRYAVIQSIVDNRSLYFSNDIASYVIPDLGYKDGHFVSLFAPGVSIIAIPFYIIGKYYNLSQVITFFPVMIVAFLNFILIVKLTKKLTGNEFAGIVAGILFIFATNAYSYALTLYQHHFTTFAILGSIYLLTEEITIVSSLLFGALFSLSFFVEYVAPIFLIPSLLLFISKSVYFKKVKAAFIMKIKYLALFSVLGLVVCMIPTFLYNKLSYDNPFQMAGTVAAIKKFTIDIDTKVITILSSNDQPGDYKGVDTFFDPTKIPFGFQILLSSFERGVIFYSPVILLGLLVFAFIAKFDDSKKNIIYALFSTTLTILLLYGMWGDPWGGWAFGPRYLIPALATLSVLLGVVINEWNKKILFTLPFLILSIYSLSVNVIGALTTNAIPPLKEHDGLSLPPLSYLYNLHLVKENIGSSYFFKTYLLDTVSLSEFALLIGFLIYGLLTLSYIISLSNNQSGK